MPDNLTDDPTVFPSPVQVPAAADPRSDTSVATPFQQVANRTANNKARLDAVVPFSAPGYTPALPSGVAIGPGGMLTATTLAALASIPAANRSDQMQCAVASVNGSTFSPALYEYSVGGTDAAVANVVIVPGDTVGRWYLQQYGALGAANGIAQLDSTGRVPAANQRNGTVYENYAQFSSSPTLSAGLSVIPGTTFTIAGLLPNDIVRVDFTSIVTPVATVNYIFYPSVQGLVANTEALLAAQASPTPTPICVFGSFTIAVAGTYTAQAQAFLSSGGGGGGTSLQLSEIRVRVVRP